MYILVQLCFLISTCEVTIMEYTGDTNEDAYLLMNEGKELPKYDWLEYMLRTIHLHENHPLTFYNPEEENFLWEFL